MKKESIFDNKTFLVVLSVVMAFFAWLFVALDSNDTKGKTISGVSIDMEEVDESIGKLGLSTISSEQPKVSVRVEGVIYDIGNLTADDIRVYPDISKVTTAGMHTIELKGEVVDGSKDITIEEISPSSIQIKFDSLQTKTLEIKAKLSGYSAPADNYLIRDVSVSPSSVAITGPAEDIARISQCVVEKDIDQELTSSYTETLPLKFLDADGNELDLKYVVSDVTEARVTIPILKKKVVPVTLDFINVPDGFPVDELDFTISNEEIEVAGPPEAIDNYASIPLGQIDIKSLDLNKTESFEVKLPTGFVNTQNIQNVLVQFNSEGMIKKSFNVSNIVVQNVPLNYEAQATTQEITNVEIVGPQEIVESLVAGDIVATVDLQASSSITSGQVELPVTISVPKKGLVWAVGDYKAIVLIEENNVTGQQDEATENQS
ncbi:CdaR family protein [uncultured Negativibacillus sp.]|uniref:CdaR family protein n=1 Tax=uncultured Negativibacillus sp. TaxID=1980696 RepID=UPI0025D331AF|nr:CdaR family protein [uncultured Negativibacillus sp.]